MKRKFIDHYCGSVSHSFIEFLVLREGVGVIAMTGTLNSRDLIADSERVSCSWFSVNSWSTMRDIYLNGR